MGRGGKWTRLAVLLLAVVMALTLTLALSLTLSLARLRGEGVWWIVSREILPNALPPLLAEFGVRFCYTLLFIASLSFLGLWVQPPNADWGSMVKENATAINLGGIAPLYPAVAIALLTIAVNCVVDWFISTHSRVHGEGG